jgi:hypothetical protein
MLDLAHIKMLKNILTFDFTFFSITVGIVHYTDLVESLWSRTQFNVLFQSELCAIREEIRTWIHLGQVCKKSWLFFISIQPNFEKFPFISINNLNIFIDSFEFFSFKMLSNDFIHNWLIGFWEHTILLTMPTATTDVRTVKQLWSSSYYGNKVSKKMTLARWILLVVDERQFPVILGDIMLRNSLYRLSINRVSTQLCI